MARYPTTGKQPLRDDEGDVIAPSPEAFAWAKGIKRGFTDPKLMALDALAYLYGPVGGLVSQISKTGAVSRLARTMEGSIRSGATTAKRGVPRLKAALGAIRKTPQEILDQIEDVRFDPDLLRRKAAGSFSSRRKTVKLNPDKMRKGTPIHEFTHSVHRLHPFVQQSRNRWEEIFNYIQNKANSGRVRAVQRGDLESAIKYYKAAPAENLANRVAKRVSKQKGPMSVNDYLKIYDEEITTIKKALKETAPKMLKEAENWVDLTF